MANLTACESLSASCYCLAIVVGDSSAKIATRRLTENIVVLAMSNLFWTSTASIKQYQREIV
jgi:hypothetical protein